eukprot:Skav211812  [mRNA]  locus=scaffold305:503742:516878:- [translate_table: standard]
MLAQSGGGKDRGELDPHEAPPTKRADEALADDSGTQLPLEPLQKAMGSLRSARQNGVSFSSASINYKENISSPKSGAQVLTSARGRAVQMNSGARATKAPVLLFLHADTDLPEGAIAAIQEALSDTSIMGGCFELRFHEEDQSWTLQLSSWFTRTEWFRSTRLVFGDRGIFVMRLAKLGPSVFHFIPLAVTTSARRLLEVGPMRQQLVRLGWQINALRKMKQA